MEIREFRKLNIDLPLQPTYNQLPWLIAGLLFALTFLFTTAYTYLEYKGRINVANSVQRHHVNH